MKQRVLTLGAALCIMYTLVGIGRAVAGPAKNQSLPSHLNWRALPVADGVTLANVVADPPWITVPYRSVTQAVVGNRPAMANDVSSVNAQNRGISFWLAPATAVRLRVISGNCGVLRTVRKMPQSNDQMETSYSVSQQVAASNGIALLEPAGRGAIWWLTCQRPASIVVEKLVTRQPALAWEQAEIAVSHWIESGTQMPPPAVPGDDGSLRHELLLGQWLAGQLSNPSMLNPWRRASAQVALLALRSVSDPYLSVADVVTKGVLLTPEDASSSPPSSAWPPRADVGRRPWRLDVTGPALLAIKLQIPRPVASWNSDDSVELRLAHTTNTWLSQRQRSVVAPLTWLENDTPFPERAPSDGAMGRDVTFYHAVPAGKHQFVVTARSGRIGPALVSSSWRHGESSVMLTASQLQPTARFADRWHQRAWLQQDAMMPGDVIAQLKSHADLGAAVAALLTAARPSATLANHVLDALLASPTKMPDSIALALLGKVTATVDWQSHPGIDVDKEAWQRVLKSLHRQLERRSELLPARLMEQWLSTSAALNAPQYSMIASAAVAEPWSTLRRKSYRQAQRMATVESMTPQDAGTRPMSRWQRVKSVAKQLDGDTLETGALVDPHSGATEIVVVAEQPVTFDVIEKQAGDTTPAVVRLALWPVTSRSDSAMAVVVIDEVPYPLAGPVWTEPSEGLGAGPAPAEFAISVRPGRHKVLLHGLPSQRALLSGPIRLVAQSTIDIKQLTFWTLQTPARFDVAGAAFVTVDARLLFANGLHESSLGSPQQLSLSDNLGNRWNVPINDITDSRQKDQYWPLPSRSLAALSGGGRVQIQLLASARWLEVSGPSNAVVRVLGATQQNSDRSSVAPSIATNTQVPPPVVVEKLRNVQKFAADGNLVLAGARLIEVIEEVQISDKMSAAEREVSFASGADLAKKLLALQNRLYLPGDSADEVGMTPRLGNELVASSSPTIIASALSALLYAAKIVDRRPALVRAQQFVVDPSEANAHALASDLGAQQQTFHAWRRWSYWQFTQRQAWSSSTLAVTDLLVLARSKIPAIASFGLEVASLAAQSASFDAATQRHLARIAYGSLMKVAPVLLPASRLAANQAKRLTYWSLVGRVDDSAGFESLTVPWDQRSSLQGPQEPATFDDAEVPPWPASAVLRAQQQFTIRSRRPVIVTAFCASASGGHCTVTRRVSQRGEQPVSPTHQWTLLPGASITLPSLDGPVLAPAQQEIRNAEADSLLAIQLLEPPPAAGSGAYDRDSALQLQFNAFVATSTRPVRLTIMAPVALEVATFATSAQAATATVTVTDAADSQSIVTQQQIGLPTMSWQGVRKSDNRLLSVATPVVQQMHILHQGPVQIEIRPSAGSIGVRMSQRDASRSKLSTIAAMRSTAAAQTQVIRALATMKKHEPLLPLAYGTMPGFATAEVPSGPAISLSLAGGRNEFSDDATDSQVALVAIAAEVDITARWQRRWGYALASVRMRQQMDTGESLLARGLWQARPLALGLAPSVDVTAGVGDDKIGRGVMLTVRGTLSRSFFLDPRWRLELDGGMLAAVAPVSDRRNADSAVFSNYRRDHWLQSSAGAALTVRTFSDQRAHLEFNALSNRSLRSIDQVRARIGWVGLFELGALRGPVLALDYHVGYRFVDDDRSVALTRHDVIAQLRWPLLQPGSPWLLGLSLDLYYVSGRSWANALAVSLQFQFGEPSYRSHRPNELPLLDYLAGTSWR